MGRHWRSPPALTPLDQLRAATQRTYPPALTGLRGSHPGAFEFAHQLAREGETFDFSGKPVEEEYDLVVVGGGISGLAAAWFYREAHGDAAKILIIENHDDFGGHAKRNEFSVDGHPTADRLWRQRIDGSAAREFQRDRRPR